MNKQNTEKRCCINSRTTTTTFSYKSITQKDVSVDSNETLSNFIDSIKFMSSQFHVFGKQLNEVLNSFKEPKEEHKKLKENNSKLYDDIRNLNKKINELEQKTILNNVEIVEVPEKNNKNCKENDYIIYNAILILEY